MLEPDVHAAILHVELSFRLQVFVCELDSHRAFAHSGGDALNRASADIACCENTRNAGL
jgi:hypothetical protein